MRRATWQNRVVRVAISFGLLVLGASLSLACRGKAGTNATPIEDAALEASSAPPRAAPPERDSGAAAPFARPKAVPANLLQTVPSKLAVSSTVDNPRDFPEHLIDGQPETAWNGKSGDLAGAWIAFRVPADAHVDHVEMNVGFDKKSGDVDLFTANHRIKRVKVRRGAKVIGEVTLDVENRGLQKIPVDADGGPDFKIEIVETVPGTKPEWRELVVSELVVVGRPGKTRRPAGEPLRVSVADLDARLSTMPFFEHTESNVYASVEAFCAARIDRARKANQDPPSCKPVASKAAFTGDATYKSLRTVEVEGERHYLLELGRGFVALSSLDPYQGPLCPSIWLHGPITKAYVQNGHFVAWVDGYIEGLIEDPSLDHGMWARGAMWCRDVGGELRCSTYSPQYHPPLAFKTQPRGPAQPWDKIPWSVAHRFDISPAGDFILQ